MAKEFIFTRTHVRYIMNMTALTGSSDPVFTRGGITDWAKALRIVALNG